MGNQYFLYAHCNKIFSDAERKPQWSKWNIGLSGKCPLLSGERNLAADGGLPYGHTAPSEAMERASLYKITIGTISRAQRYKKK